MARRKKADVGKSLKKMLSAKPSEDNAKKATELGLTATDNSDIVAAALLSKAVKGEVSAIKELRDIVKCSDEEENPALSRLYEALEKEDD